METELANYLAEIWGLSITIIALAMIVKQDYIKKLLEKSKDQFMCWGVISTVIGLAMILKYNIWVRDWHIIVTLIGWIALVKGVIFLFMPELARKNISKIESSNIVPYIPLVMLVIGLVITYLGFTA